MTTDRLGSVRSGVLAMTLLATPESSTTRGEGFEISGPFSVATQRGTLPIANIVYTRIAGSTRETARFTSNGRQAFVTTAGRTSPVPRGQLQGLFATGKRSAGPGGLEGLHLDKWMRSPRLSDGGHVDGTAVDKLTGNVDPVAAINDLVTLATDVDGSVQDAPRRLEGADAARVRRAVHDATAEVRVGKQDHLLRRLQLAIHFALADNNSLRQVLRSFTGAVLRFDLTVDKPNQRVPAPTTGEESGGSKSSPGA